MVFSNKKNNNKLVNFMVGKEYEKSLILKKRIIAFCTAAITMISFVYGSMPVFADDDEDDSAVVKEVGKALIGIAIDEVAGGVVRDTVRGAANGARVAAAVIRENRDENRTIAQRIVQRDVNMTLMTAGVVIGAVGGAVNHFRQDDNGQH